MRRWVACGLLTAVLAGLAPGMALADSCYSRCVYYTRSDEYGPPSGCERAYASRSVYYDGVRRRRHCRAASDGRIGYPSRPVYYTRADRVRYYGPVSDYERGYNHRPVYYTTVYL
jgi:hypothetical protein